MYHECCFTSNAHWILSGRSNGDNYLFAPQNSHTFRNTHMSSQLYKHTHDSQITIKYNYQILKTINSGRF